MIVNQAKYLADRQGSFDHPAVENKHWGTSGVANISHLKISSIFPITIVIAVVLLAIDASISQVADFLIGQAISFSGISLFVGIFSILILLSLVLFRIIRKTTSEIRASSVPLKIVFALAMGTQIVLIGILVIIIMQIILVLEYYSFLLIVATVVSYASAAGVMFLSALTLFGWYKINRSSYVVLIFAVAFAVSVFTYRLFVILCNIEPIREERSHNA